MLYNIAQAYRLNDQPAEAIRYYRRYLQRAPEARNRDYVERKVADLEKLIEERRKTAANVSPPPPPTTPQPTTVAPPLAPPVTTTPAPPVVTAPPLAPPPPPPSSHTGTVVGIAMIGAGAVAGGLAVYEGLHAKKKGDAVTNASRMTGAVFDATQQANVRDAAQAIAALHATHRLVVTHGNGPQVGLLALQAEAYPDVRPYPLDVLGAETEGMIGYLLDQALLNELPAGSRVATLLTQTVVDPADPAFAVPSKPIGPVYEPEVGERLARERGWIVRPDGPHVRRVVASPQPIDIVEIETIRLLLDAGVLVVCAGGGGIPVVAKPGAGLAGVEAVVDKDLSAALLAEKLEADFLLMLTDVPAVEARLGDARGACHPTHARPRRCAAGLRGGLDGPEGRGGVPVRRADGRERRHRPARPGRRDHRR